MKVILENYSFNKATKVVTFTPYPSIELNRVLAIINTTRSIIIYNPAKVGFGGTVSTNLLTLTYDTSAMNNADSLQIHYDEPEMITNYEIVSSTTYFGEALPSTVDSDAKWRVSRLDESTGKIKFANGNTNMTNIWNNRASLSYL